MKTKKSNRVLSAVLAILMVLAVCPMFALSAAEPAAQSTDPITYWDGNVPYYGSTFAEMFPDTTIPEFIMSGGDPYIITKEEFDAHLAIGDVYLNVKDEVGLAMLSLITNAPTYIYDENGELWFDSVDPIGYDDKTDPNHENPLPISRAEYVLRWANYKTVYIQKDMYLNAPGAHTNQIAPLFWEMVNVDGWYAIHVNGQGHSINGWYMDVTLSSDKYLCNGFIGATTNADFVVQNLALIDMEMNIVTATGITGTLNVGGIVGGANKFRDLDDGRIAIKNCVVDLKVNYTSWLTATSGWMSAPGCYWDTNPSGGSICDKMDVGGLAGNLGYFTGAVVDGIGQNGATNLAKLELTNNLIMMEYTVNTGWGRVSPITCGAAASTSVNIDNNIVAKYTKSGGQTSEMANGSIYKYETAATNAVVTDLWTVGTLNAKFTDTSNKASLSVSDIASDAYWETNGAGMADGMFKTVSLVPVPTVFSENADVLAAITELMQDVYASDLNSGATTSIGTATELIAYVTKANELGKAANIKLTANIDLAGKTMPVIKTLNKLDGQGHIISNYTQTVTYTTSGREGKQGGLCEKLTGSIENVAFTNYNVTFTTATPTTACEYYVGGLYGNIGSNASVIKNVYLQGSLAISGTTTGNTRIGYFGASEQNWAGNVGISIDNSVFVGQVTGGTANYFAANFGETANNSTNSTWNAILSYNDGVNKQTIVKPARQVKITNCYAIPYKVDAGTGAITLTAHTGNNIGLHAVALRACYQTGMTSDYHLQHGGSWGYTNVVDENGNSLAHLDCFNVGDVANNNLIGAATGAGGNYVLADFQGAQADNAMKFSNASEWIWFANGTPIPAVFGDNADALSVKSLEGVESGVQQTIFVGAQLRLDKAGLRFVAEFDVENHLALAGDKTVEFGFLILPTVAITTYGQTLTYDNANVLKISTTDVNQLLEAGDARLGGITVANEGSKILMAVMTSIPDAVLQSATTFTVQPFVAYLGEGNAVDSIFVENSNVQQFSGVGCANALCADQSVSNDVKQQVCGIFEGLDGFEYAWDDSSDSCKFLLWRVNATTQIVYSEEVAFSTATRAAYNAYYMEMNVVSVFREELNKALGTSITATTTAPASGAKLIEAKVVTDSGLAENEYRISVVNGANHVILVEAGHYAALETALDALRADMISTNGIIQDSYSAQATTGVVVSGISSVFSAYGASVNNYKLVWSDEFNESTLDHDRWCYDASNPAKGVADISLSNKATVTDGNLNINTLLNNGVYEATKLVTTFGTMNWNGGYLEMKGSIPYEALGKWVSMWATTGNSSIFIKEWQAENGLNTWGMKPTEAPSAENNYAGNGMGIEVDMLETMSQKDGAQTAVHLYPAETSSREQNEDGFTFGSASAATGYHTYGFFWNRDYMVFTIDGAVHYTFHLKNTGTDTTDNDYIDGTAKNYYTYGDFDPGKIALSLILQNDVFSPDYVALDGWPETTWTAGMADGSAYNYTFAIDYVRLYQTEGDMLYLPHDGVSNGVDAEGNYNWSI